MKFTCETDILKTKIALAAKVAPTSPLVPSLGGLLLRFEEGSLTVTSTNLEVTFSGQVFGKTDGVGEVCVSAKLFNEACQALKGQEVVLEFKDNKLHLSSGGFSGKLLVLPTEDFPKKNEEVFTSAFELSSELLKTSLGNVSFASAVSETQPEIASVLLRLTDGDMICTATDRFRLAEFRVSEVNFSESLDAIIPTRAVSEILRFLSSCNDKIELAFSEGSVSVHNDKDQLTCRLVNGQYPAYEQILSIEDEKPISVRKESLLEALRFCAVIMKHKGNVRLDYGQEKIKVSVFDDQSGEGSVVVDALPGDREGSLIFSLKYLLDGLLIAGGEMVSLGFASDASPVCFTDRSMPGFRYIIMPVRE